MRLGQRLKELRNERGKTQYEMSQLLGMQVRGYQLYEHDDATPVLTRLVFLADYFDVSLDYLTGRSDHRTRI